MAQSCASANQRGLNCPAIMLPPSEVGLVGYMERTNHMPGYQVQITQILNMVWILMSQKPQEKKLSEN